MVSLARTGISIENDDILAITSKIVSLSQNRIVKLDTIEPSTHAFELARKHNLDPAYVELILREADEVYGGTDKALCTIKDGVMIANAGIDRKNMPSGYAVLYPKEPNKVADTIRKKIYDLAGKFTGVIIVDSRVTPLRMGTVGIALGFAGFEPVYDYRGFKDLYGKPLLITRHCQVDDLAGAAHLLMGELDEKVITVLMKGAPIKVFHDFLGPVRNDSVKVPPDSCLFISALHHDSVE